MIDKPLTYGEEGEIIPIERKSDTILPKWFRTRYILGDVLLFIALFFFLIVVAMTYDFFFMQETYPFNETRRIVFLRNFGIMAISTLLGSYIGYGKLFPIGGRVVIDPTSKIAILRFGNILWRLAFLIIGLLVLAVGLFGLLGFALLWEEGDIESLITVHIPINLPLIVFGLKWSLYYFSFNPVKLSILDKEKQPFISKLLDNQSLESSTLTGAIQKFEVTKPTLAKWFVILSIAVLLNWITIIFTLSNFFLLSLSIISIIISLFFWRFLSPWIIGCFVINTLKTWNEQIKWEEQVNNDQPLQKISKPGINIFKKILLYLIGLKLSPEKKYFLDAKPKEVNLNDIKGILKGRAFELMQVCFSIVFIVLLTLNQYYTMINTETANPYILIMNLSYMLIFSPILVFWLIPMIWTVEDLHIKSLDDTQTIVSLVDNVRGSQLDWILGFGGIMSGIGFVSIMLENYPAELSAFEGQWPNRGALILEALFVLFLLLFLFAGIVYLVGVFHLAFSHQSIVNRFREELTEFLPICTAVARKITVEEEKMFEIAIDKR